MQHHEGPITIAWHDRDGTRTLHGYNSPTDPELNPWLESVLGELRDEEYTAWLQNFGGPDNGTALLVYYEAEGIDDQGSFEVFFGNDGVGIFDLYAAANPDAACNAKA